MPSYVVNTEIFLIFVAHLNGHALHYSNSLSGSRLRPSAPDGRSSCRVLFVSAEPYHSRIVAWRNALDMEELP